MFPTADRNRILFVHGAAHDGASWDPLRVKMQGLGYSSGAVDLPSVARQTEQTPSGIDDDIAVIRAALVDQGARIVVCHSYGGVPTTAAITPDDGVELIVYLAAFVPDDGESLGTIPVGESPEGGEWTVSSDGRWIGAADPYELFYHRCAPDVARRAVVALRPHAVRTFDEPITRAAWHDVPSAYVITLDDHAILPERQRLMAERTGRVVEIDADHSPFLSYPAETARLLDGLIRQAVLPAG